MKLGITTNVYAGPLKSREVDLETIFDTVPSYSIKAVEIRDDLASLDEARVKALKLKAEDKDLTLSYGIRNDMLADGDKALFEKGVKLASICGFNSVLRILAAQDVLKAEGKFGYSQAEVEKIRGMAELYGSIASTSKVQVAIEHAREPLYGDGRIYFGMAELIKGILSKNVGLAFDPANSTNKSLCKAPSSQSEVLKFIDEFGGRFFIVHYKTTKDGVIQPSIGDADVDNTILFERLNRVYSGILCIEIPGSPSLKDTNISLESSINYLKEKGLFRFLE